jgi:hypothetical protein
MELWNETSGTHVAPQTRSSSRIEAVLPSNRAVLHEQPSLVWSLHLVAESDDGETEPQSTGAAAGGAPATARHWQRGTAASRCPAPSLGQDPNYRSSWLGALGRPPGQGQPFAAILTQRKLEACLKAARFTSSFPQDPAAAPLDMNIAIFIAASTPTHTRALLTRTLPSKSSRAKAVLCKAAVFVSPKHCSAQRWHSPLSASCWHLRLTPATRAAV